MAHAVLFVCLGNICRSPTAEGVFRGVADEIAPELQLYIDSAGTSGYHAGERADSRAVKAAKMRGFDLSKIRSRQVHPDDFDRFDLIMAMDNENYNNLIDLANREGKSEHTIKVKMFLSYAQQSNYTEVPDPYYGGEKGFDLVIDLVEDASKGLVQSLRDNN